jgi:hypothetical protein
MLIEVIRKGKSQDFQDQRKKKLNSLKEESDDKVIANIHNVIG